MLDLYHFTKSEQDKLLKSITIICDTREHENGNKHITDYFDSKSIAWKKATLAQCDYSFYIPKNDELNIPRDLYFDRKIAIERKNSLDEFAGNIGEDRSRLKKEFSQAPKTKIIIIENGSFVDLVNGCYRSNYNPKSYYGTMFSFWHEFDLPFIFMPDKRYTGMFIIGYFQYYLRNIIK